MNNTPEYDYSNQEETRSRRRKKRRYQSILFFCVFMIAWVGLAYGGFYYTNGRLQAMQDALNSTLADVQQTNALNVKTLEDKLAAVEEEMKEITFALEETGKEVSSSGMSTRQQLDKRMEALDRQLEELKNSLEILKESKGEVR